MKKEFKELIAAILFSLLLWFGCDVSAQTVRPRLDTVTTYRDSGIVSTVVILTDTDGSIYEVLKSATGRSYIIKNGKRRNLRRKPETN